MSSIHHTSHHTSRHDASHFSPEPQHPKLPTPPSKGAVAAATDGFEGAKAHAHHSHHSNHAHHSGHGHDRANTFSPDAGAARGHHGAKGASHHSRHAHAPKESLPPGLQKDKHHNLKGTATPKDGKVNLPGLGVFAAPAPGQTVKIKLSKRKTLELKGNADGTVDVHVKEKKKHGFFGGLFHGIGKVFHGIGKAVSGAFKFIGKALPIVSTVAAFIPGLQPLALAGKIFGAIQGGVNFLKNGFKGGLLNGLVNLAGVVANGAGAFGAKALAAIASKVGQGVGLVKSTFDTIKNGFKGGLLNVLGSLSTLASNVAGGASLLGSKALAAVSSKVANTLGWLQGGIATVKGGFKGALDGLSKLTGLIAGGAGVAASWTTGQTAKVAQSISALFSKISNGAGQVQGLMQAFKSGNPGTVMSALAGVVSAAAGAVGKGSKGLSKALRQAADVLGKAGQVMKDPLQGLMSIGQQVLGPVLAKLLGGAGAPQLAVAGAGGGGGGGGRQSLGIPVSDVGSPLVDSIGPDGVLVASAMPMTTGNAFTDVGYGQANEAYHEAVQAMNQRGHRRWNHIGDWAPPLLRDALNGWLGPIYGDTFKEYVNKNSDFYECSDQAMFNADFMNKYFKAHGLPLEAGFETNDGHAWLVVRDRNNPNGPKLYGDSWQNWPDMSNSPPAARTGYVWPDSHQAG